SRPAPSRAAATIRTSPSRAGLLDAELARDPFALLARAADRGGEPAALVDGVADRVQRADVGSVDLDVHDAVAVGQRAEARLLLRTQRVTQVFERLQEARR